MRHITPYKLFESFIYPDNSILQYLYDIIQELVTVGLICEITVDFPKGSLAKSLSIYHETDEKYKYDIVIRIYSDEYAFLYEDIEDYILSATEYMKSIGYEILFTDRRRWTGESKIFKNIKFLYSNAESRNVRYHEKYLRVFKIVYKAPSD
jgi:hypothetical protein